MMNFRNEEGSCRVVTAEIRIQDLPITKESPTCRCQKLIRLCLQCTASVAIWTTFTQN